MKLILPLLNPLFDDPALQELCKEFKISCQVEVWRDTDFGSEEDDYAYGFWIEYGEENNSTLLFKVELDQLEMFAHAVLKDIEMLRRDYAEIINERIKTKLPL